MVHTHFYVWRGLTAGPDVRGYDCPAMTIARSANGRRPLNPRLTMPQLWAFLAVALPVVAALGASLSTIDLAYNVRAGQIMLDTGSVLRTDPFSFTSAGLPWLNQQWGAQLLFGLSYRVGGFDAIAVVRALAVGSVYLLIYLSCRALGASMRVAAGLVLLGFTASMVGLAARPQVFATVLFALVVWILATRRATRWVWAIPALVLMWANVHGTFPLGILLAGLACVEAALRRKPDQVRTLLLVTLAAVAATLVNPFGPRVWSYALGIPASATIRGSITEWQAPTARNPFGAVFFLSGGLVAAILARQRKPTPVLALVALAMFFGLGLYAMRATLWWGLIFPPVVSAVLGGTRPATAPTDERPSHANALIAVFVVLVGLSFVPWLRERNPLLAEPGLLTTAPGGITSAVSSNLAPGERMFNAQIWGSWFELALPADKVFVDSRIELYPTAVWKDYYSVSEGQEGWQQILDRWDIGLVAASRSQQAALIPRISRDPGWERVYADRQGVVFVRSP